MHVEANGNGREAALMDLSILDAAQLEAVNHVTGPILVLAGPGSGKTRVVVHRIANLIHGGVAPWRILALTFTNKAAEEMSNRLADIVGPHDAWVSTFHRFCARFLRQHASLVGLSENYSILDTRDSRDIGRLAVESSGHEGSRFTLDAIMNYISRVKGSGVLPEDFEPPAAVPLAKVVADVYPEYQRELLLSNAVDFDDLLLYTIQAFRENPDLRRSYDERYHHVLVDEYQDTNHAQFTLMRMMSIDHRNVMATGDPDQSIYGWRGADIGNILNFEVEYPDAYTVRLEQNYRSTVSVVQTANSLIVNNQQRKPKTLFTNKEFGEPVRSRVYPNDQDEANDIVDEISQLIASGQRKASDFAIFYRTNSLSRLFEIAFAKADVPFQIVRGQEFFQRKEIKDLLAYLHLVNNPSHNAALLRVINTPVRGIGKTTVERLEKFASDQRIPLLEAARQAGLIASITGKQSAAVAKFVAMYDRLCVSATAPVDELLNAVLAETGYEDILRSSEDQSDSDRADNIVELVSDATEFAVSHPEDGLLEGYLETRSLVNDTDKWSAGRDAVSMMTLHAAKGLEFPCVYIVAVEQGYLPHERNYKDPLKVEEERRLFFVGITRAQERLQVSSCATRLYRGQRTPAIPSPFLMEIKDDVETIAVPSYGPTVMDEPSRQRQSLAVPVTSAMPKLMTGSQMLTGDDDGTAREPNDPDEFHEGMVVHHPKYGPGVVLKISGEGKRSMARVKFFGDPLNQSSFSLYHSPLRPARHEE